jgi:hypothetical protein
MGDSTGECEKATGKTERKAPMEERRVNGEGNQASFRANTCSMILLKPRFQFFSAAFSTA